MSDSTIPDALAADLRDYFLATLGVTFGLDPASVRLKHATEEIPSPRVVILMGDPGMVYGMEATAKILVSIQYITSSDSVSPEAHQEKAGELDNWCRSIRGAKRRAVISSRVFLHDSKNMQAITAIRKDEREQMTAIRAEMTVTLVEQI